MPLISAANHFVHNPGKERLHQAQVNNVLSSSRLELPLSRQASMSNTVSMEVVDYKPLLSTAENIPTYINLVWCCLAPAREVSLDRDRDFV